MASQRARSKAHCTHFELGRAVQNFARPQRLGSTPALGSEHGNSATTEARRQCKLVQTLKLLAKTQHRSEANTQLRRHHRHGHSKASSTAAQAQQQRLSSKANSTVAQAQQRRLSRTGSAARPARQQHRLNRQASSTAAQARPRWLPVLQHPRQQ